MRVTKGGLVSGLVLLSFVVLFISLAKTPSMARSTYAAETVHFLQRNTNTNALDDTQIQSGTNDSFQIKFSSNKVADTMTVDSSTASAHCGAWYSGGSWGSDSNFSGKKSYNANIMLLKGSTTKRNNQHINQRHFTIGKKGVSRVVDSIMQHTDLSPQANPACWLVTGRFYSEASDPDLGLTSGCEAPFSGELSTCWFRKFYGIDINGAG